eukprot:8638372-Pyramimonas_sp.AAC.1
MLAGFTFTGTSGIQPALWSPAGPLNLLCVGFPSASLARSPEDTLKSAARSLCCALPLLGGALSLLPAAAWESPRGWIPGGLDSLLATWRWIASVACSSALFCCWLSSSTLLRSRQSATASMV